MIFSKIVILLLLSNIVIIISKLGLSTGILIVSSTVLVILFLAYNINPANHKTDTKKLKIIIGGCELLKSSVIVFITQVLVYLYLYIFSNISVNPGTTLINTIVGLAVILVIMWNGIIRIVSTSTQLGFLLRISLLIVWWIPLVNIIVILKCCSVVNREFKHEMAKVELNNVRKEKEVCKTKYPILMVHGIFWRDWQFFNYWGRISGELIKNGAVVYYGNQQSAACMEICAQELKDQILNIIDKEKC
jgi:triacylglycerol lipase